MYLINSSIYEIHYNVFHTTCTVLQLTRSHCRVALLVITSRKLLLLVYRIVYSPRKYMHVAYP